MGNGSGERFIALSKYGIREKRKTSDKSTTPTYYSSINGIYCVCFVDLWRNIHCRLAYRKTFESHSNLLLLNRFSSHQVTQNSSLISNHIYTSYLLFRIFYFFFFLLFHNHLRYYLPLNNIILIQFSIYRRYVWMCIHLRGRFVKVPLSCSK